MHNFTVSAQDIFTFRRLSVFTVSFTGILQLLVQIMKRFVPSYWLVKWLWYRVYNQKVVSSSPRVCVFFIFIRFVSFHLLKMSTTSEEWILGSFYFKRLMCNAKNEPVCPKHLQRLLENIVPYYSLNIWLKCILYTLKLFELSSVGKRLKKNMQQVLALRQNRFFLNICDY